MSIANAITAAINNFEQSGEIQKLIEKHLAEAVNGVVEDLFRYRSPIREAIKEAINSSLAFDPSQIKLPDYQVLLGTALQSSLDKAMLSSGIQQTEEIVSGIIGKMDPGPIKLSSLIEMVKESEWIDDDDEGHDISCHIDQSGSFTHVYADFEEHKRNYECRFRFTIYDGRISRVEVDGFNNAASKGTLKLGHSDKLQSVLTRAFVTKHPIVVDVTDPDDLDLEVCGENVKAQRD